uniref:C-type lectin domain-containing protein n=1 Tax=Xiphophorus couchianus TaxID=32473 RepID=A0A3B5LLC9_9TELE
MSDIFCVVTMSTMRPESNMNRYKLLTASLAALAVILQQNIMLPSFYLKTEEGCRHCLPGWTFMSSSCYYFPFSDTFYRTSWNEARQFCRRQGGDLAIVNNREKFLTINQDLSRQASQSGFWIGLRDVEEEGVWKWVDGTRLTEGFWNVGEPNNLNNEDCAAVYPKSNPFMSWNDAPCNYNLKWICEMAPRIVLL